MFARKALSVPLIAAPAARRVWGRPLRSLVAACAPSGGRVGYGSSPHALACGCTFNVASRAHSSSSPTATATATAPPSSGSASMGRGNFFAFFDLPKQPKLDVAVLQRLYHDLQRRVHPDQENANATPVANAAEVSSYANAAYETLKDPYRRCRYLARLDRALCYKLQQQQQGDAESASVQLTPAEEEELQVEDDQRATRERLAGPNAQLSEEFLFEMIAMNELIFGGSRSDPKAPARLRVLQADLKEREEQYYEDAQKKWEEGDIEEFSRLVDEWTYISSTLDKCLLTGMKSADHSAHGLLSSTSPRPAALPLQATPPPALARTAPSGARRPKKLIPSSAHSLGGQSSRSGSRNPPAASARAPAKLGQRSIRGALPMLSGRAGIAVLSADAGAHLDGQESAAVPAPAYLSRTSNEQPAGRPSSAVPPWGGAGARPSSARRPTLELVNRPRGRTVSSTVGSAATLQPVYAVGEAVLNPFTPISPSVRSRVRGRSADASRHGEAGDDDTCARVAPGPTLRATAAPDAGDGGDTQRKTSGSSSASAAKPSPPEVSATYANLSTPQMPQFRSISGAGPFPSSGDDAGGVSWTSPAPMPAIARKLLATDGFPSSAARLKERPQLLCVEGVVTSHERDRVRIPSDSTSLELAQRAPAGPRPTTTREGTPACVEQLRLLYGTTADDVPVAFARVGVAQPVSTARGERLSPSGVAPLSVDRPQPSGSRAARYVSSDVELARSVPAQASTRTARAAADAVGTTASDLLPELLDPEARCAALATIRRRIDWDVTLAARDGQPPPAPAIAFLAPSGEPVAQLVTVRFLFDSAACTLCRADADADSAQAPALCSPVKARSGGRPTSAATPSAEKQRAAAAVRTVGCHVTRDDLGCGSGGCLFRAHGLIGLLPGLAEKMGLDRVMEYRMQVRDGDSAMTSRSDTCVDADSGDLVVCLNPGLLGTLQLRITGLDCAAVNPATGTVTESVNALEVLIDFVHGCSPSKRDASAQARHKPCEPATRTNGAAREQSPLVTLDDAGTPPQPQLAADAGSAWRAELSIAGDHASPPGLALTLASFTGGGRDARAGSPGGAADGTAGTPALVPPRTGSASAGAVALWGRARSATDEHGVAAATGYEFPLTNPHELFYEECKRTSTAFIATRLTQMRSAAEEATRRARTNAQQRAERAAASDNSTHSSSDGQLTDGDAAADPLLARDLAGSRSHQRERQGSVSRGAKDGAAVGVAAEHDGSVDALQRTERLWRWPFALSTWLCMGSVQSPLGHLRLCAWQDRFTALFTSADQDLFTADGRSAFKRRARAELSDHVVSSLANSSIVNLGMAAAAAAAAAASATGGLSSTRDRGTGFVSRSPPSMAGSTTGESGGLGTGSGAAATSQRSLYTLRRLVLCLLMEENRGSQQLFADTVEVCGHLAKSALLRTITSTGGTPEGLQLMAASVLAPTPSQDGKSHSISEKERLNLVLLADMLEVCLVATVFIGCYADAARYATQRVHAQCLVDGDTTTSVCSAQRDLAEVLLFFGDYAASLQVSKDVLMLVEQLYDVHSTEELEAKLLLVLAFLANGQTTEARQMSQQLAELVGSHAGRGERSAAGGFIVVDAPPAVRAAILLVHVLVESQCNDPAGVEAGLPSSTSAARSGLVAMLHGVVELLSVSNDGAEMDKSISMAPSAAPSSSGTAGSAAAARRAKRGRWGLQSLAATLLLLNGELTVGLRLLETIAQELALTHRRVVESSHRAHLSATLWVTLMAWKTWERPSEAADMRMMLRRVVQRHTRARGPFHPLSALANLALATVLQTEPRSHALSIAQRSLSALRRCVSPRSNHLVLAYTTCSRLAGLSHRWRQSLEHANNALVIAQLNSTAAEACARQEEVFLGALLRCPSAAEVRLQPAVLTQTLAQRLTVVETAAGAQSERLVQPLVNLAEAHYILGDTERALGFLQRALRLTDSKNTLLTCHAVIKPTCQMPGGERADWAIQQRRLALHSLLQSPVRLLTAASLLFAIGAVLEARGETTNAQDAYLRALALIEAAGLAGSLCSVRVYTALAKSHYSSNSLADALGWAETAQHAVRTYYKDWPQEMLAARTIVSAVQERIYDTAGSYGILSRGDVGASEDAVSHAAFCIF